MTAPLPEKVAHFASPSGPSQRQVPQGRMAIYACRAPLCQQGDQNNSPLKQIERIVDFLVLSTPLEARTAEGTWGKLLRRQ